MRLMREAFKSKTLKQIISTIVMVGQLDHPDLSDSAISRLYGLPLHVNCR